MRRPDEGLLNRLLRFLGGVPPRAVLARFLGARWSDAHRRAHGAPA